MQYQLLKCPLAGVVDNGIVVILGLYYGKSENDNFDDSFSRIYFSTADQQKSTPLGTHMQKSTENFIKIVPNIDELTRRKYVVSK